MNFFSKIIYKFKRYIKSRKDSLLFYKLCKISDYDDAVNEKYQFIRINNFKELEMFAKEQEDGFSDLVNNDCKKRFENGSVMIVAVQGREWVSYGWTAKHSDFWIAEIDYIIDMSNSKVQILYDFRTREKYRGLGVYPLLIRYMVQLQPELEYLIYCYEKNISSRRGIEKAGGKLECKLVHKRNKVTNYFSLYCIRVLGGKYRYLGFKYAE